MAARQATAAGLAKRLLAALSIPPQEGSGGCVPRPRKLNAASLRIAWDRYTLTITISGASTLGSTYRRMARQSEAPITRADSIYGSAMTEITEPRTTRA